MSARQALVLQSQQQDRSKHRSLAWLCTALVMSCCSSARHRSCCPLCWVQGTETKVEVTAANSLRPVPLGREKQIGSW
jgi:hypothetical protein